MFIGFDVKYTLFLLYFKEAWLFSTGFRKILKCKNSWKFVQWEPSCFIGSNRQADMTKLIFTFCNSMKAPKNAWAHSSFVLNSVQPSVHFHKHCRLSRSLFPQSVTYSYILCFFRWFSCAWLRDGIVTAVGIKFVACPDVMYCRFSSSLRAFLHLHDWGSILYSSRNQVCPKRRYVRIKWKGITPQMTSYSVSADA
jgi:hypothetical protein